MEASVDTAGLVAAIEQMGRVRLDPFFASLAEDLASAVHDEFHTSGHGAWQALASRTLRAKARKGKSAQPLIYNGVWMGNPTVLHDSESAEVTTNVAYAKFHVSSEPRTKIPLRNPYAVPDSLIDDAANRLALYIASGGTEGQ